jgi:hypothetical protein
MEIRGLDELWWNRWALLIEATRARVAVAREARETTSGALELRNHRSDNADISKQAAKRLGQDKAVG